MRHQQGPQRNVFIFASHRGGSTWLMQLMEGQPRLRALNEPFSVHQGGTQHIARMPKTEAGQLISFSTPEAEARVRTYTEDLLSGRIPTGATWRFWNRDYPRKSDRILIKDLHAKALMGWFSENFDIDVVYLTRNPIPQSLSCLRNKWGANGGAFLRDPSFTSRIGPDLTRYARRILELGTPLEQHVLGWVLENYVPLTLIPQRPDWLFVTYEDCVLEPEATLRRVAKRLQLPDLDAMRARLDIPSRSSKMSLATTREQIARGDSALGLGLWREQVSRQEERSLLTMLERFGIPLYEAGFDEARPWWD